RVRHRPQLVVDDPLIGIASHGADGYAERGSQASPFDDLHSPLCGVGHWIRRSPPPPGDGLLTRVSLVFETDPLGLVLIPADLVVDAQRLGGVLRSAAFGMHAVDDVMHAVLGGRYLSRQDAGLARLGVVLRALRRRKLVAALRATSVTGGDYRLALGALFGGR